MQFRHRRYSHCPLLLFDVAHGHERQCGCMCTRCYVHVQGEFIYANRNSGVVTYCAA